MIYLVVSNSCVVVAHFYSGRHAADYAAVNNWVMLPFDLSKGAPPAVGAPCVGD